ncbi:MAG TPA: Uma2 family endonuclease [Longimicrobium sp.]|nr:Uma2 family endonuclease [Longimicrobium sp.]
MTPAQYLSTEREADYRSEFVNGRVQPLERSNRVHNLIVGNTSAELWGQLRGGPCEVYVNDMRVKVEQTGMYTYPDIVGVCEAPELEDEHVDTLLNPGIIIEVLSPSTERYDRGEKFAHYRRLPSLQEYVLIAQDTRRIDHYRRNGDSWVMTEVSGLGAELVLASVGATLTLADIYDRVVFADQPRAIRG